jgi:PAP2 superfamily.
VRRHDQQLRVLEPGTAFMTEYDNWLAVQNGEIPNGGINRTTPGEPSASDIQIRSQRRYMITGRDLATYVLENVSQQPYVNAALILQNNESVTRDGLPLGDGLPVDSDVPSGFVDYSRTGYQSLLAGVLQAHKHAAWYHKWRVHRRPRPEAMGGRVYHAVNDTRIDGTLASERYPLDGQLLDARALERVREADRFGTALLPQAYPEGAPTHPSYPGGHAVTAGSCATVLKAYFDEDARIANPVRPTTDARGRFTELEPVDAELTVGGEINKLATNMSYSRSWAGIHYRSDTTTGLRVGERVATSVLRDRLRQRPADAYGSPGAFRFTTFDGVRVEVTADGVTSVDGADAAFDPPLF